MVVGEKEVLIKKLNKILSIILNLTYFKKHILFIELIYSKYII